MWDRDGFLPPADGYAIRAANQLTPDTWTTWYWMGGRLDEPQTGFAPGTYNVQCAYVTNSVWADNGDWVSGGTIQTWSPSKVIQVLS